MKRQSQLWEAYYLACPQCSEQILLPRRSPLGEYGHRHYQPTDIWPIRLLCNATWPLCEVAPEMIHRETGWGPVPPGHQNALWQIAIRCDRENCGSWKRIYGWRPSAETSEHLSEYVRDCVRRILCARGHEIDVANAQIEAEPFGY